MAFIHRHLRNVKARVMVAKGGEKLQKRVVCKIFIGKMKPMIHPFVAPAGKGYSEDDVYMIRARVIDHLDHKFPLIEFNEVEISQNQFNYVACGARSMLQQPELNDEQRGEAEGAVSGGSGGPTLTEQIARAIDGAGGGREGDEQGDGDAPAAGSGDEERSGGDPGPDGGTEDHDIAAGSTAHAKDAAAAEVDPSRHADGDNRPKDLQDQGPHDQRDRSAHDAAG